MKIPIIDNIIMTSDKHNIILNREMVYEKGKKIGQKYLLPYSYFSSVTYALESVLDEKMIESTARSIKGLIREHAELVGLFRKMLGAELRDVNTNS